MKRRDIQISGFTAQGPRRYQQDAFQIACTTWGAVIGAVADGVGACARSGEASRLAVNHLVTGLRACGGPELPLLAALLSQCVKRANDAIECLCEEINDDAATTLTWFCVQDDQLDIHWIGDSPGFLIRDNRIHPLTLEHSLAGDFCRMRGRLSHMGKKTPESNTITRWLGSGHSLDDQRRVPIQPGDEVLICTDGVTKSLGPEHLVAEVKDLREREIPFEAWAQTIVELAIEHGSKDNATAVFYRHTSTPELEPVTDSYFTTLMNTRILRGDATDSPQGP